MAKTGRKQTATKTKPKRPPAKRRGQWHTFGPFQFKYVRTRRQLVVSFRLPNLPHHAGKVRASKRRSVAKRRQPVSRWRQAISWGFTGWLFIICLVTAVAIFRPVPKAEPRVEAAQTTKTTPPPAPKPPTLARSIPTHLQIPTIGVDAGLEAVGLKADGTIAIPAHFETASWYNGSPTPGELGPSVIVGHLDSIRGAAVFYNLKKLQPNDQIWVTRQDGSRAIFKVDKLESYPQNAFPTQAVYGNIDHAGLRLITCSGDFNYLTRHYSDNIVVYATLVPPAS